MISVVVAAHNEASVIGRCVASLQSSLHEVQVVVVPNGCTDATARQAELAGARVVEIAEASKTAALNAGDQACGEAFPRIYLDADIVMPPGGIDALIAGLAQSHAPLVVVPNRRVEVSGRPLLVRAYYAINTRLPAFTTGLFGRGVIAISAEGRQRFDRFPRVVADDLYLDSLFSDAERAVATQVQVVVDAPHRTVDLLRRLVRVRRGNAALRAAAGRGEIAVEIRRSRRAAWLTHVVLLRPWLMPAAAVYVSITLYASLRARLSRRSLAWERDESSRSIADAVDAG